MIRLVTHYAASYGKPNIIIRHFPDTESYVRLPATSLRGKNIVVYHRLYPEPDKRIFELLLILNTLKKQTKAIDLLIPYLPYARQDRENKSGEAVSADILCGVLKDSGVNNLITYDCHFLPGPGKFKRNGLMIENRSAGKELLAHARKFFKKSEFLVISPDEGSSYFTENAQGHALKKVRRASKATGEKTGIHADIHKIESKADVKGKNICILDDIISTGGTILRAIEHLKEKGAKKIIVGATHGVFAKENIEKHILDRSSGLFVTDSILKNPSISKIKILKLKA